jgi:hypothetical protein
MGTAGVALLLVATASLWQAATPPTVAATQDRLSYVSSSTWLADPANGRVQVTALVTATSHTLNAGDRHDFYDRIQLTLPLRAVHIRATTLSGAVLAATVQAITGSNTIVSVDLGQRLYSEQSMAFDVMFDLVDSGGSSDRTFRIGKNLMSFPVAAFGSPETPGGTVTVEFPPGFTVTEALGDMTRTVYGSGEVVFASGVLDAPTQLLAIFTAVQPVPASDMRVRYIRIGPLFVGLRYWVDDIGWADEVERVLRAGYPVLRDMIGLGDPAKTTFTIEEASSQAMGGFSGSYDEVSGQAQVGYLALPYVILHETVHLWFNNGLVSDRWVQEGFAAYYAEQAVNLLGFTAQGVPLLTPRVRLAAVPLNDWVAPGEPSSAQDYYLYGASLEVAGQIADLAGEDGLRRVWRAAAADRSAYQPVNSSQLETAVEPATDWRRLLDLLEQATGKSFAPIWRLWVMDANQTSLLQQRDTTRAAYADAVATAGSWDLPPEVRRALDSWQFGRAAALLDQSIAILNQRGQIAIEAAIEQTSAPPTLKSTFEHVGLAAAATEINNELAVIDELSAARRAGTESGSAAEVFGLLGADPQADLASARSAFARGDLTRAMSLATSARAAWQSAGTAGQVRIMGSLAVLVGILMLLGVLIWIRRDRSRRRAGEAAMADPGASPTEPVSASDAAASTGSWATSAATRPTPARAAHEAAAEAAARRTPAARKAPAAREAVTTEAAVPAGAVPAGEGPVVDDGLPGSIGDTDAIAVADGVAARPDESAYDLLHRGNALLRARHNAQAAVVLERAARLETNKGSILEALGRAYYNSGQHARAAETFEELLEIDPSAHYAHFALGLSFARLGRRREAMTHLRMAAALDPASDTYRRALDKIEAAQV